MNKIMRQLHRMTRIEVLTEIDRLQKANGVSAHECLDFLLEHSGCRQLTGLLLWLRGKGPK
jgi:hypothetical protein